MSKQVLLSTITCPYCGTKKTQLMPTNSCRIFYECESCHKQLKPLEKDCCVYCSYGSVKCPSRQEDSNCC